MGFPVNLLGVNANNAVSMENDLVFAFNDCQ